MSDAVQVSISGDSPEAVAFALYQQILSGQHTMRASKGRGDWAPPKDWILQSYAECLSVVKSGSHTMPEAGKAPKLAKL